MITKMRPRVFLHVAARSVPVVRGVFAAGTVLHAALAVAQPVLAGWSLDGDGSALDLHGINGALVLTVSMILVPVSILWWRPGRGTVWAPLLTTVLFTAETFQLAAGYADVLVVHVPLGVAVLLGSLVLAGLALRHRTARSH